MFGDLVKNLMGWEIQELGDLCLMDRQGIKSNHPTALGLRFIGVENVMSGLGTFKLESDARIGGQKSTAFFMHVTSFMESSDLI